MRPRSFVASREGPTRMMTVFGAINLDLIFPVHRLPVAAAYAGLVKDLKGALKAATKRAQAA